MGMKKDIRIRLAARCEAAGRPNNEDNYQDKNIYINVAPTTSIGNVFTSRNVSIVDSNGRLSVFISA